MDIQINPSTQTKRSYFIYTCDCLINLKIQLLTILKSSSSHLVLRTRVSLLMGPDLQTSDIGDNENHCITTTCFYWPFYVMCCFYLSPIQQQHCWHSIRPGENKNDWHNTWPDQFKILLSTFNTGSGLSKMMDGATLYIMIFAVRILFTSIYIRMNNFISCTRHTRTIYCAVRNAGCACAHSRNP